MSDYASYEEILPLLDRPKKTGAWIMSFCPNHQDRIRSLGLSEKGVLECMTGCSFKDVIYALRKGGGGPSPLTKPSSGSVPTRMTKRNPNPAAQSAIATVVRSIQAPTPTMKHTPLSHAPMDVTTDEWVQIDLYEYRTQTGEIVAEKARFHSLTNLTPDGKPTKKFLWRLPGANGWTGLQGKYVTKDLPLFGIERLAQ